MSSLDIGICIGYLIALLLVGVYFSRQRTSSDMFAAGGSSPWWVAGLSGFMTIFSAGTFVVWGGIAYREGLVAVSILMAIGVSMLGVGRFLAWRWKELGITTPAEYVQIRFSPTLVQVYTWMGCICRMIGMAVALYSLSVMLSPLIPLKGGFLCDSQTGSLSIPWGIIICGSIVVFYTMIGGLWAVLMTDVIQCLVLCLSVMIVVPLALFRVGGVSGFIDAAPKGLLSGWGGEFTLGFLILWMLINFFQYGADWAFIQRYLCVPSARDARKSAYLMGVLYLVSPLFWMFPAMAYRVINPQAHQEEAYIQICREVLPSGMLGIVLAAMFSATASMISSQLNVYAGVFTCNIYPHVIRRKVSERHLVIVGRIMTAIYGVAILAIALAITHMGSGHEARAKNVVLTVITVMLAPLAIPLAWSYFSRRLKSADVIVILIISYLLALMVKFGVLDGRLLFLFGNPDSVAGWVRANYRLLESASGLCPPLVLLGFTEYLIRRRPVAEGYLHLRQIRTDMLAKAEEKSHPLKRSRTPALMVSGFLALLAVVVVVIGARAAEQKGVLFFFAALLIAFSGLTAWLGCKRH